MSLVEQVLGQGAHQLGFADAGGSQEDEAADGPVRVAQPGAVAQDGVRDQAHGFVLADDALLEPLGHVHQLLDLAFQHAGDRDAGPLGDDAGDVLFADFLLQQGGVLHGFELLLGGLDFLFDFREPAVAELGGFLPVAGAAWPPLRACAGCSCSSFSSRTRPMAVFSRFQRSLSVADSPRSRSSSFSIWRSRSREAGALLLLA